MRIAIVGSGISGLGSAWLLQQQGHAVTLFESASRLGGHTATVDVTDKAKHSKDKVSSTAGGDNGSAGTGTTPYGV